MSSTRKKRIEAALRLAERLSHAKQNWGLTIPTWAYNVMDFIDKRGLGKDPEAQIIIRGCQEAWLPRDRDEHPANPPPLQDSINMLQAMAYDLATIERRDEAQARQGRIDRMVACLWANDASDAADCYRVADLLEEARAAYIAARKRRDEP